MKKKVQAISYDKGYYKKPHALLGELQAGRITKSEYFLLDVLLHLQNIFNRGDAKKQWFYTTDETICKTGAMSFRTLRKSKDALEEKGYIKLKRGHSHVATEYRFMFSIEYDGTLVEA